MDVNVTFVLTPFSLKTNTYGKKEMAIRFKCNHIDELKNLSGLKIIEEANPYYEFTRSYIDYKTQTLRISFKENGVKTNVTLTSILIRLHICGVLRAILRIS